jgi:hypothetical protein
MKGHVKDRLRGYGVYQRLGDTCFHPTVGTAVKAYLAGHDVPWLDWEDAVSSPGAGPKDTAAGPEDDPDRPMAGST